MNERIKELWRQAGGHYNSGNQHTWPEYTIADPEKFALLIIKECVTTLEFHGYDDAVPYVQWMATNKLGVKE